MSNRIINLNITDAYISMAGDTVGASGAMRATTMRMTFDEHWAGTSKTAYFTDALGEASVSVLLSADMLVDGMDATYDIPIPAEAMTTAGLASVTVRGIVLAADNTTVTRTITTKAAKFRVMDSEIPSRASNEAMVTATDKQQMQAALDKVVSGESARVDAENARVAAEAARQNAETGYVAQAAASASSAAESARLAAQVVLGQIPDASLTMAKMAPPVASSFHNRQLLDNHDFRVNQRGQINYESRTSDFLTVDRWCLSNGNLDVHPEYITLKTLTSGDTVFYQKIPISSLLEGSVHTLSVMLSDRTIFTGVGTIPVGFAMDGVGRFSFSNGWYCDLWASPGSVSEGWIVFRVFAPANTASCNLASVKLELGSVSTLANDSPADHVAECQKYAFSPTYKSDPWAVLGVGVAYADTAASVYIPTPVTMRSKPVASGGSSGFVLRGNGQIISVTSIVCSQLSQNGVSVDCYGTGLVKDQTYVLSRDSSADGTLLLSADL